MITFDPAATAGAVAYELGAEKIALGHLVQALQMEPSGHAAGVIAGRRIVVADGRMRELTGSAESDAIPMSRGASRVLRRAEVEARRYGSGSLKSEHVLLALLYVLGDRIRSFLPSLEHDASALTTTTLRRMAGR